MIRTHITRTLATSAIHAYSLKVVDGVPQVETLPVLTVAGKVTEKEALKVLRDVHGKEKPLTISAIDVEENVYKISVSNFLLHAEKVEQGEEEPETEQA